MFSFFKNQKLLNEASDTLLMQLNSFARNPQYFGDDKIADDPDGRFEAVALFAVPYFMVLGKRDEFSKRVSQKIFDKLFKSFDDALRLLGVGDLGVGRRVKQLSESFFGRQMSYKTAIENSDKTLLEEKIALNVLSKEASGHAIEKILCDDVFALYNKLEQLSTDEILASGKFLSLD